MSNRRFAERDWVDSTLSGENLRPPANLSQSRTRHSGYDSALDLRTGLDVIEFDFDTIPGELLDHFEK